MEKVLKYLLNPNSNFDLSQVRIPVITDGLINFQVIGFVAFGILITYFVIRNFLLRKELRKPISFLELNYLQQSTQSLKENNDLFKVIFNLLTHRSFAQRFFGLKKCYSSEIVASKEKGLRFLIRVPNTDVDSVRQTLSSYLPGVEVKIVDDYLSQIVDLDHLKVFSFKLRNNDNFPLKTVDEKDSDPIKYLTGSMAKLKSGEQMAFQLVLSANRRGKRGFLINNSSLNQEYYEVLNSKRVQPLFNASMRLLVSNSSQVEIIKRQKSFLSALALFDNPGYQSIATFKIPDFRMLNQLNYWLYRKRLGIALLSTKLSISEVSNLFHLPFSDLDKTENTASQFAKLLPTPIALKSEKNLHIKFAKNTFGGVETSVGLTLEERRRHVYIIGATGTGKSTLLFSMINEDLKNNQGLGILDPHGDLAESLLNVIPDSRISDVVYFNPDDIAYPIGINIMELSVGLTGDDLVREKDFIAESIISLFHKIYDDKYSGPRMEYILRNAIHTAFYVPNATLFTIYKLLINTKFRNGILKIVHDENLLEFWKLEFSRAGDYQKVKMISPITNKIGRFLFSPIAKRILEQPKSTINFEEIINNGKILICNLAKGMIGEDNSEVFGIVIMTKLQIAALRRARIEMEKRRDFFLYVDEFQNFATPAFNQILSEARKYRLCAILAHQTTSQLEDKSVINVTLANAGTVISFRTANPEDESRILPIFSPQVVKGEIGSLPAYNFYMRISAIKPEEPFSGVTIPVKYEKNLKKIRQVIESSRKKYAIKYMEKEVRENPSTDNLIIKTKTVKTDKIGARKME